MVLWRVMASGPDRPDPRSGLRLFMRQTKMFWSEFTSRYGIAVAFGFLAGVLLHWVKRYAEKRRGGPER